MSVIPFIDMRRSQPKQIPRASTALDHISRPIIIHLAPYPASITYTQNVQSYEAKEKRQQDWKVSKSHCFDDADVL